MKFHRTISSMSLSISTLCFCLLSAVYTDGQLITKSAYVQTGELYSCPKCGDQFHYSNCLRAHLRFRCRYRKQHPKTSEVIASHQPSPHATSGQLTSSSNDANIGKAAASSADTIRHSVKRKTDDESDGKGTAIKRRLSTDVPLQPAVIQGPRTFHVGGEMNKFIGVVGAPRAPCRSAFQRVDKAPTSPTTPPSPSQAISSSSPSDVASIAPPPLPLSVATSASLTALDNTSTARHSSTAATDLFTFPATLHSQRLHTPMMLDATFVTPNNPTPNVFYPKIGEEYARNFVTNNNIMTRNDVKFLNQSPPGITVDPPRHSRLPQPPAAMPLSVHNGYRTSNPMVERLLQLVSSPRPTQPSSKSTSSAGGAATLSATFPSLQLAQNWCAKCNTSFRMTSDLVYHMRTHHKRDLEPASQGRRKDDNKLRCDVCGETFKERHHLTRHMTSHT